ncbi:MAG: protein-L-isoaspartate(D-aspartate) O-methyltransferase [Acidobacteria bacterium]|jgi:protein-L-isoaspartate(D-aspartate) O-methyltransferase|nr:MAG: protein-L-isoaspartate(D-aspartate) O-methyltransferase [Acidobacteriota bacterium]GIU81390.1 MAG: protein-L-isoaspartate O-methyltransferase [Pyrinomonadaceae bacterium]
MNNAALYSQRPRDEFEILREKMVAYLREHYGIKDERVLEAMQKVPREKFVPEALKSQAYKDNALPIAANQTISQPFIVAKMTELLELSYDAFESPGSFVGRPKSRSRVLEVGTGSGYQAAILAHLTRMVYSIERIPQLAHEARKRLESLGIRNVVIKCSDGSLGWEIQAPFDAIIVTAASPKIPTPLLSQLKIGGRLVIPVGEDRNCQRLIRITKKESGFSVEDFGACSFVPLIGEHGWKQVQ